MLTRSSLSRCACVCVCGVPFKVDLFGRAGGGAPSEPGAAADLDALLFLTNVPSTGEHHGPHVSTDAKA